MLLTAKLFATNMDHLKRFKMLSSAFVTLFIFGLSSCSTKMSTVYTNTTTVDLCSEFTVFWTVASNALVFGEDVELICKTTAEKDVLTNCSIIWTGGPKLALLSLDGFPTKNSKYWPPKDKYGLGMIIRNFSRQDLNQEYICSIGLNSCKRNLTSDMFDNDIFDKDISKGEPFKKFVFIAGGATLFMICIAIIVVCLRIRRPTRKYDVYKGNTSPTDYLYLKRSGSQNLRLRS